MAYEEERLLELSKKTVSRIYKDIDMSFEINPVTKDIGRKYDVNAVKQSIKNLLLTPYFSKPFTPKYGSPIFDILFEPMDMDTASLMGTLIQETIDNFEPRCKVEDVIVFPNYNENEYRIQINFYVVGVRDPQIFRTSLKRLR